MRIVKSSKSGVEPVKVTGPSKPWDSGESAGASYPPAGGDRAYLGYRFILHFKATEALETGIEYRRNVHGFCCRDIRFHVSYRRQKGDHLPPLTRIHGFSLDPGGPATTILSTWDLQKLGGDLDVVLRVLDLLDTSFTRVILGPRIAV